MCLSFLCKHLETREYVPLKTLSYMTLSLFEVGLSHDRDLSQQYLSLKRYAVHLQSGLMLHFSMQSPGSVAANE